MAFARLNKKSFSLISLSLVLSISVLAGCGKQETAPTPSTDNGAATGPTGKVVITTFGGKYDEVFTKYVKEPFETANPGVTVVLAPYTGIAKLAQGASNAIDVVSLDDFDIIEAANKGMLAPLKKEEFENWDKLYPQAIMSGQDGTTFGLVNVFGAWGIAYNPKEVAKPESWNDFWKPENKGKVAQMSQWIPDILMTMKAKGTDQEKMDPVWEAYKALTPSVKQYYTSFSAPESLFSTGEITMASWFDGRAESLKAAGKPIDFVIPKEGGVLIRSAMGVVKDSKQQELARKLIDYTMRPEVQVGFAKEMYYGPTNTTVELDKDLQDKVVFGKEKVESLIAPDWNQLLPKREEWLTKWTEVTTQ